MATNTLNDRSSGETIVDTFFNDIHDALNGDFVGRNSSGVATSGQNLGTVALPWGTIRSTSIVVDGTTLDPSLAGTPQNIVKSGKTRSTSNQPAFLVPSGAGATATIDGTPTNLVLDINGTEVTVSTDLSLTGLTLGPSATHTCLVNNSDFAGEAYTRQLGEENHSYHESGRYGSKTGDFIPVDTMGATLSAKVGMYVAIKIAGGATEYALAFVESATKLSRVRRGYFYDSSSAPINRTTLTDNDTITLMSLGWVFVQSNGTTTDVTYTVPTWAYTAPTSPATGDYWYDQANQTWKRYDGASWQIINRTLIGMVVLDNTNCVAARSVGFYKNFSDENSIKDFNLDSSSIVTCKNPDAAISIMGNRFYFGQRPPSWNITTMLATSADMISATEQASRTYYLYLTDEGKEVISDIAPYPGNRMRAPYNPHNPWRCVGTAYNDGSSNLIAPAPILHRDNERVFVWANESVTSCATTVNTQLVFPTKPRDNFSAYNTTTGVFTAPKTALYFLRCSIGSNALTPAADTREMDIVFSVNAFTVTEFITKFSSTSNDSYYARGETVMFLNAGDQVTVNLLQNSGATFTGNGGSSSQWFQAIEI